MYIFEFVLWIDYKDYGICKVELYMVDKIK